MKFTSNRNDYRLYSRSLFNVLIDVISPRAKMTHTTEQTPLIMERVWPLKGGIVKSRGDITTSK